MLSAASTRSPGFRDEAIFLKIGARVIRISHAEAEAERQSWFDVAEETTSSN